MAGAEKTYKKAKSDLKEVAKKPWKGLDPSIGKKGLEQTASVFTPEIPEVAEETIIPIPDENTAILEARKRRAKASRSGRDSTILTEGLGG